MFNKLKSQLNEKSGSDIIPTVTSSNKSIRKNSEKALQRIKSNQSDGNHSSDDTSSLKSQKINYENVSDENRETINNVNIDLNNSLNSSTISENKKDDSLKSQLQELNQSLLKEIDKLHIEINQKHEENEELRSQLAKYKHQLKESQNDQEQYRYELENFQRTIDHYESEIKALKNDKEELIIKNAELSEKYELLKLVNTKQSNNINSNFSYNESDVHKVRTNENEYENSDKKTDCHDENRTLREELSEKNKTIKNLQQRLNDMKKTLQKELKYHMLPNEKTVPTTPDTGLESPKIPKPNLSNTQISPVSSNTSLTNHQISPLTKKPSLPHSTFSVKKNLSSSDMSVLHEDVNFKYLKHVIVKFLTSREYEALHLVKALSVLLNLSNDEEKIIKDTLEWKMSWFGSKPKLN